MTNSQNKIQTDETSLIEKPAHQVGINQNAGDVYGPPIEHYGVTVITVAKAFYGVGGSKKEKEEGSAAAWL